MSVQPLRRTLGAAIITVAILTASACSGTEGTGPSDDPEPAPSIDLGTVDLRLQEDSAKTVDLSGIVTNGSLSSVNVTSGPVTTTLSGTSLQLTPEPDEHGTYRLEFTATGSGGTTTRSKDGRIEPLVDIPAGQLQDNESDQGRQGHLRLYTPDGSLLDSTTTDASGNYAGFSNLTDGNLVFQAALTEGGNLSSYVRTLRVEDGEDVATTLVRAVPYPTQLVTKEEFQQHVHDVTGETGNRLARWNLTKLEGIYLTKTNPEVEEDGKLTTEEQELIRELFTTSENIPAFIQGYLPDTVILGTDEDESPPYTTSGTGIDSHNGSISPQENWIVVVSDTLMNPTGKGIPRDDDNDGLIDRGLIRINSPRFYTENGELSRDSYTKWFNHEAGHVVLPAVHHSTISRDKTIMHKLPPPNRPTYVDAKTGSVLLDETYAPCTDREHG